MVYLRNARLRWSVAAEEKEAVPLISHYIGINRNLISRAVAFCNGGEREG